MKKILLIGGTVVSIALLTVFLVVPAFAQDDTGTTPTPSATTATTCPNMQQLCQNGDYQAMIVACQKIADGANMPCLEQNENTACPHQGSSGQNYSNGMMGGGMMRGGMMRGGMMGNYENTSY